MAEPIQLKSDKKDEIPLNRTQRRKLDKSVHHNVYTKKYRSLEARETAWKLFLGGKEYGKARKQLKEVAREIKAKRKEVIYGRS